MVYIEETGYLERPYRVVTGDAHEKELAYQYLLKVFAKHATVDPSSNMIVETPFLKRALVAVVEGVEQEMREERRRAARVQDKLQDLSARERVDFYTPYLERLMELRNEGLFC